jgi:hypothetical protein
VRIDHSSERAASSLPNNDASWSRHSKRDVWQVTCKKLSEFSPQCTNQVREESEMEMRMPEIIDHSALSEISIQSPSYASLD